MEDYTFYAYVIAGEEAMEIIDSVKAKADIALARFTEIAEESGATVYTDDYGRPQFKFENTETQEPPEGWVKDEWRGGTYFEPDMSTEKGQEISRELSILSSRMDIQARFNDLCHQLAPCSHVNNRAFTFHKYGENTVIKCPVDTDRQAFVPSGCTQISFMDYLKMKLDAEQPAPVQTKVFTKPLQP